MARRLALKRLTASDLTFFRWHFVNRPAGNQKAINLNADVFIGEFYPSLPEVAIERQWRFPLDLSIYGPGSHGLYNIQRKIIKGGTYKNWRLDGEFIFNPEDAPERFNILAPEDIAVIEFVGPIYPYSANLVLLAKSSNGDNSLHQGFEALMGNRSMVGLSSDQLAEIAEGSQAPEGHPIFEFVLEDALEDSALGGVKGIDRLGRRPGRSTSREELDRAKAKAGQIGQLGEAFVNSFLLTLKVGGKLDSFRWVSDVNAVAPYDFEIATADERVVKVDVKTTKGRFENPIHISYGELIEMSKPDQQYDLYRVFEIDEGSQVAHMRIAKDLEPLAETILKAIEQLPDGISPDGFSVNPANLEFGDTIDLVMIEDDQE